MKRLHAFPSVFVTVSIVLASGGVAGAADTTKPVTTITLSPATPDGSNSWYKTAVAVIVSAIDNVGVTETRCVLDPASPPGSFDAMPAGCAYVAPGALVSADRSHLLYAASRDAAGNKEAPKSKVFKIDTTPPIVTGGAPNRAANSYGWYTSAVTVVFTGTDATSGPPTCSSIPYSGPDSATASVTGTCTDKAGNVSVSARTTFKYDATPPTASLAVSAGTLGNNGWFVSDVTVQTSGDDTVSTPVTCTADQYRTADTSAAGRTFNGSCLNAAGLRTSATPLIVKLDKTPPSVAVSASPDSLWPPNHQLADVAASVVVTDAASGPAGFVLDSAVSSEPDERMADGDAPGDIQGFEAGTADAEGQLRAERSGRGGARVYTLTYSGTDQAGNSAIAGSSVIVAHDAAAPRRAAVDAGAARIAELQRMDPGWEGTFFWYVGHTGNVANLTGVTAIGLLEAYRDTKDERHLDAAMKAAAFAMTHLGSGATGTKHGVRMTAPDVTLLHLLTEVTGDPSYSARASIEWANIRTFWPTAGDMDSYFRNTLRRRLGAWDLAAYLEAAKASGDEEWASGAAAILANLSDTFYYGADNVWAPMPASGALRALVGAGYAETYPAAVDGLLAMTLDSLSGDNVGGSVQATAYVGMALRTVGGEVRSEANAISKWLAAAQNEDGGWVEWDGKEYPEGNGEALRAIAQAMGANVVGAIGHSRSGNGAQSNAVRAHGRAAPFDDGDPR